MGEDAFCLLSESVISAMQFVIVGMISGLGGGAEGSLSDRVDIGQALSHNVDRIG